jgi:hypothetical protein
MRNARTSYEPASRPSSRVLTWVVSPCQRSQKHSPAIAKKPKEKFESTNTL